MVLLYYRRMLDIICTTYVYCILIYVVLIWFCFTTDVCWILYALHTYIVYYYMYKYIRQYIRILYIIFTNMYVCIHACWLSARGGFVLIWFCFNTYVCCILYVRICTCAYTHAGCRPEEVCFNTYVYRILYVIHTYIVYHIYK